MRATTLFLLVTLCACGGGSDSGNDGDHPDPVEPGEVTHVVCMTTAASLPFLCWDYVYANDDQSGIESAHSLCTIEDGTEPARCPENDDLNATCETEAGVVYYYLGDPLRGQEECEAAGGTFELR